MKKKVKEAAAILAVLVLSVVFAAGAFAEDAAERVERSVFKAGQVAENSAEVDGAIILAGYEVNAGGSGTYAALAGNAVKLTGSIEKDAFIAGSSIVLSGSVARDVYAAGKSLELDGDIGRNVYAKGEKIVVNGFVGGDLRLDAQKIEIAEGAVISGKLYYNEDAEIILPESFTTETETFEGFAPYETETKTFYITTIDKIRAKAISFVGIALVAFVLLWFTPFFEAVDRRYTGAPFKKYAAAFGIGFGILAGVPLGAIILMVTGVGLRIAFLLIALYAAVIIASPVVLGFVLGRLIWRKLFRRKECYYAELPIGLLAAMVIKNLPYVGILCAIVSVAFGVLVLA
ncbi:MAG: hypothetical protein LUG52_09180 [Clostridia bacterium]|nr:hypothetical protein [Clostridia bacterium]